ncbi:hypothetical protein [Streptomyces sp. NPDC004783]|uniref:hypothetical protein n=1 Tax=Streptomyces sp. NPDC004783 TaxID=3154459 RepID=UPI0033B91D08
MLGGNQIGVEHRFFGTSRPAAPGLTRLTIRQAADDQHRVVRGHGRPAPVRRLDGPALHPLAVPTGHALGYLTVPTAHLDGLLRYPGVIEPRSFVPRAVPMRFDAGAMRDIDQWVRGRGDRVLFVNGGQDPSVAESFRPGGRDSRALWVPGGNHHVTVADLPGADRAVALAVIRRWAQGSGAAPSGGGRTTDRNALAAPGVGRPGSASVNGGRGGT